jgi:5-methylcytosine-specific restriction endonuclease McrA
LHPDKEHISIQGASYRWEEYHGLRLYFCFPHASKDIEVLRITSNSILDSRDATTRLVHLISDMMREGLPGAQPLNRLTVCSLPECASARDHKLVFCKPVSKSKWVCSDCEEEAERAKRNKKRQRSAATPALRYKVLERDGFKCQACGRSAKEHGAVLRVDHIVAVANGGKTAMENLQTLCDECNSGKSDSNAASSLLSPTR